MFPFSNDNKNSIILTTEGVSHLPVPIVRGVLGELTHLLWFVGWRINSSMVVVVLLAPKVVTVCYHQWFNS